MLKVSEAVEKHFHRMLGGVWQDTQIDGSDLSMTHYSELMDIMDDLELIIKEVKADQIQAKGTKPNWDEL